MTSAAGASGPRPPTTDPVRAGLTYPVTFTFEHAGSLTLSLPVENPDVLPPRSQPKR